MKYVYVAGPYTNGYAVQNTRNAIMVAEKLVSVGYCPFIPHPTLLWDIVQPHDYQFWIDYDNNWLLKCDALLRMPGNSPGGDREVVLAKEHGIPVFYTIDDLKSSLND